MSSGEHSSAVGPLLAELAELGYTVSSVGELPRRFRRYPDAIPILLRWLPTIVDFGVKVEIAQAVAVRWARPLPVPALVDEYRLAVSDPTLQWMLGDALARVANEHHFEEIAALAKHRRYGKAREMVVVALGNMQGNRAVALLMELLTDDEVAGHAIIALGKIRTLGAKDAVTPFLPHHEAWVRKEATRALAKIAQKPRPDSKGLGST